MLFLANLLRRWQEWRAEEPMLCEMMKWFRQDCQCREHRLWYEWCGPRPTRCKR